MPTRKIPTVLGILAVILIVASLAFATSGVSRVQTLFTKASETPALSHPVETANISDTSFTVIWATQNEAVGAVFYGDTPELKSGVAVDQRKSPTHFVAVQGLKPSTKYYFKAGESEPSFGPFELTTGPTLNNSPKNSSLTGTTSLTDGIAIWQSPGSTKIAALVLSDGSYTLDISKTRTQDETAFFAPEVGTPEKVVIISGSGTGQIDCFTGSTTVLPKVQIGETISCTGGTKEQSGFKSLLRPATQPSQPKAANLNIKSGETVSTGLPTFSGKTGPKQVIKIEVHSDQLYSGTVIAGSDGSWSWTPPSNLAPGEHAVTITIKNPNGTIQTITRTFFVNGGQSILPITSGTPSGELTITPTPTPTDTLVESGVQAPTFLALTIGFLFIILSIGVIYGTN